MSTTFRQNKNHLEEQTSLFTRSFFKSRLFDIFGSIYVTGLASWPFFVHKPTSKYQCVNLLCTAPTQEHTLLHKNSTVLAVSATKLQQQTSSNILKPYRISRHKNRGSIIFCKSNKPNRTKFPHIIHDKSTSKQLKNTHNNKKKQINDGYYDGEEDKESYPVFHRCSSAY